MAETGLAAAGSKAGTPIKDVVKDSKMDTSGTPEEKGAKPKDTSKDQKAGSVTLSGTPKVSKGPKGAQKDGAPKLTVAELLAGTPGSKTKVLPVVDENDIDEEMLAIQAKMKELEDEERRLNKSQKLREMQEELKMKQQKVKTLRGKSNAKTVVSSVVKSVDSDSDEESITIDKLRNEKQLKSKVQKIMKQFSLNDDDSSSVDTSVSGGSYFESDKSDNDSDDEKKKKKKKKKKVKSGINAKAADRVKRPQRWPQAYLPYEFVSKQLKYDDLDMKQFIAGELGIISEDDISEEEKQGRIEFLKKKVYYTAMYEFKGLKAYYAAFVRDIERGRKKWSDDPSYLESAILNKYLLKGKDYQHSRKANYPAKMMKKLKRFGFVGNISVTNVAISLAI